MNASLLCRAGAAACSHQPEETDAAAFNTNMNARLFLTTLERDEKLQVSKPPNEFMVFNPNIILCRR